MKKTAQLTICLIIAFPIVLCSCTALLTSSVVDPAVGNLQRQSDVELVCEGASAYLLMIDSLLASEPDNRGLLLTAAKAYGGSIAALDSCGRPPERLQAIGAKARDYGRRLLTRLVGVERFQTASIDSLLEPLQPGDSEALFWSGFAWLNWIQLQQGAPAAMAELVTVEKLMQRVLELDETVEDGGAHLFFGALYGSKPTLAGGDPERSRSHFERALAISGRDMLLIQTTYASTYCRMTFNRELHDRLLQEVLDFPLERAPQNTLVNQIAKRTARSLMDDGYFD